MVETKFPVKVHQNEERVLENNKTKTTHDKVVENHHKVKFPLHRGGVPEFLVKENCVEKIKRCGYERSFAVQGYSDEFF